jgi:hypothetical protein
MARMTRAASHLSVEEVKTKLQLDPRPWCRQRWLIIYNALVDPRAAADKARAYRNDHSDGASGDLHLQSLWHDGGRNPRQRRASPEVM